MPGKHATLSQVKLVVALRESGATRAVIADQVGISISTVSRICKRFGSSKGRIRFKLVEEAQQQLLERLGNNEALLQETTLQLADDLASGRIIRDKITEAVLRLPLNDPDQVANVLRALNSAASALATAQKIGRIATGADNRVDQEVLLPVLQIQEMSAVEISEIRNQQRQNLEELGGAGESNEPEMIH